METIVPIILAGGSGKRLWPLSTQDYPKQFHCLFNSHSLLQSTLTRIHALSPHCDPLIVTNTHYRFIVAEQLQTLKLPAKILLEPKQFNTAAAITLAVLYALSEHSDPMFLVCPSDHQIGDTAQFAALISAAVSAAARGKLVTFGVVPTEPATDYGYIQKGPSLADSSAFEVHEFVEKPSKNLAEEYVDSGRYFWNSGIFLFQASVFLKELQQYAPDVLHACQQAMAHVVSERDFVHFDHMPETCPSLSIDRAVFEKTKQAIVMPFTGDWHDLGTWHSLYGLSAKDTMGNSKHGHIVGHETKNSYLYSTHPLLVTFGIQNCCVVVTKDVVLVADLTTVDLEKKLADIVKQSP